MTIAIVTGAGQGIGRAIAVRLSGAGHRVVLVGRDCGKLDAVAAGLDGPALCLPADLTQAAEVENVFSGVEQRWGPAGILVASAGTALAASLIETTDEQWQRMLDVNLTAPFRCLRRALPSMIEQRWGRVVVIASVVAKRGERQVSAYAASKHGVLGLVRAAADEVARTGVTVNAVCPGYVDTPMTTASIDAMSDRLGISAAEAGKILARRQPIGRLIEADEVAQAVLGCIDNGAITGQGINVDGGAVQS